MRTVDVSLMMTVVDTWVLTVDVDVVNTVDVASTQEQILPINALACPMILLKIEALASIVVVVCALVLELEVDGLVVIELNVVGTEDFVTVEVVGIGMEGLVVEIVVVGMEEVAVVLRVVETGSFVVELVVVMETIGFVVEVLDGGMDCFVVELGVVVTLDVVATGATCSRQQDFKLRSDLFIRMML